MFQEAISRYLQSSGYSRIQLKSVLFDMDGVLFNSMPYHADAWHKVMERHGLHLSREEAYLHEGRTGAATINIVYQRQYGKDATPEMIQSIYAEKSAEFNSNPEPEPMPGAWEVLQKIKSDGLIPMVVTGSGQHSPPVAYLPRHVPSRTDGNRLRCKIWETTPGTLPDGFTKRRISPQ